MKNSGPRRSFSEAMLAPGVVKAISYAANHPELFEGDHSGYVDVMDVFQDHIPHGLIDCNQWWFGHYWSSGHRCSKCREIAQMFPCGVQATEPQFVAMTPHMRQGHDPDCSARNVQTFQGLVLCMAFHLSV